MLRFHLIYVNALRTARTTAKNPSLVPPNLFPPSLSESPATVPVAPPNCSLSVKHGAFCVLNYDGGLHALKPDCRHVASCLL